MTTWEFQFPAPTQLMNMNDRFHWSKKARLTSEWREGTQWGAIAARFDKNLPPCKVTVHLPVKRRVRRDAMNWVATVKPIVDGLVDYGVWPDDSIEWVTVMEPVLIPTQVPGMVRVVLEAR